MDRIVSKIQFVRKFDIYVKNIKNVQFNCQIFKIYSHVNFFNKMCSQICPYINFSQEKLIYIYYRYDSILNLWHSFHNDYFLSLSQDIN